METALCVVHGLQGSSAPCLEHLLPSCTALDACRPSLSCIPHCTLPAAAVQRFSLPSICSPSTQHHSQLSAGAGGSLLEPLDLVCPDMGQCWALLTEVIPACSTSITKPCCVSPIQTFSRVYFTVWDFFLNVVYFFFFFPKGWKQLSETQLQHSFSVAPSVFDYQRILIAQNSLLDSSQQNVQTLKKKIIVSAKNTSITI